MQSAKLAHQIFHKPSSFVEISHVLERAIYLNDLKLNKNARVVLTKLGTIPAVPSIVNEIMAMAEKPDFSLKEIAVLINKDLSMSVNILRLVNSPYFALTHKITSVEQAVSLLGLDILKPLIISVHFFDSCGKIASNLMDELLKHSSTTGRFCRAIFESENKSHDMCDRAFIAGFMHDIGRIILLNLYPDLYMKAIEQARRVEQI